VCIGTIYIVYSVITRSIHHIKNRPIPDIVPPRIASHLANLAQQAPRLVSTQPSSKKPISFGVYLGPFSIPPTKAQSRILAQWELLIVDPFQVGAVDAVVDARGCQVLGRLDWSRILADGDDVKTCLDKIFNVLVKTFKNTDFSGVLFAEWEGRFIPAVLNEFLILVNSLGLRVYLETAPPDFLEDGKVLQNPVIAGLVIKNASIMPNGEKRDYFEMTNLQKTVKAFVSESCLRDFVVMAWETIDDQVSLANSVVKRSVQWCSFYSAITWLGPKAALTDAALNVPVVEPLGAFEWLKDDKVMKLHDIWRGNSEVVANPVSHESWRPLFSLFHGIPRALDSAEAGEADHEQLKLVLQDPPQWTDQIARRGNPLSTSVAGHEYNSLGCFPLGFDASPIAFAEILQSQHRLKGLGLLHPVAQQKLQNIGVLYRRFHEKHLTSIGTHPPQIVAAVKELATLATNNFLKVHLGLDSGFRKNAEIRFWAVYQADSEGLEIYVSKNAQGLAGTVLHTFLSSRGFSRHQCFQMEAALAEWSRDTVEPSGLARRMVQDIDVLTPEERLLLLQHLSLSQAEDILLARLRAHLRVQLLDNPSLAQLKELNTVGFLNGNVTVRDLIKSRIAWYREQGCQYPELSKALAMFLDVDTQFTQILKHRREDQLSQVTDTLESIVVKGSIDAYADMLALSVFCAARKGAFDEVYVEVTDRNPLFNDQSDQAAAFAESFALGSRCEAYFDVAPSIFGKLLSDRYRAYYDKKQPPNWVNGAPALATAYAGAQIDCNPDDKVKPLPGFQRFTFLSVFAIPALVDIILLTTTGRGLYLSAYMSFPEQQSATQALMISLLLSGAIGTWISCGGSYYLISMAFSATNVFVLTRLIAGFAFTIAGSLIGFAVITGVRGPHAGIVFALYLVALTAYLTLFAAVASFQFPGTAFLSGRKVIIFCIPWLFVSPIVTMFSGYDSIVYLSVIYVFIGLLLFGLRHVGSKWVTWFQGLKKTDDAEIKKWFISNKAGGNEKVFGEMSDPAALKMAREALHHDVIAECGKGHFQKATEDKMVFELARDWSSTNFLLDWYCRYSDVPRPIPFSSSWNIQTKVALDTLCNAQKGIRLHSGFIHWRQAGDEVGCGILYFIVALLDKWIELVSGGKLIGLSAALNDEFRFAVGFGLAYYLIGAVLVDTKASHLHALVNKVEPTGIKTAKEIRGYQKREVRQKRRLYWTTLGKFLGWHVWGLAFSTALIWTFQSSIDAMIMFGAYVIAYTGLLWYQYTKIFSGPHALKPLLISVGIALPIGVALKRVFPDFIYTSVLALAFGTWTCAILSMWTAQIGMPKKVDSPVELGRTFHAYTTPWADPDWSQQELQTFYDNLSSVPAEARYKLDPSIHPGAEVKALLRNFKGDQRLADAFPEAAHLVNWSIEAWENGNVALELVPQSNLGPGLRAISCATEGYLKIVIGAGRGLDKVIDVNSNCQIVAETLIHSVAEALLQIPHDYAILTESLISPDITRSVKIQLHEESDSSLVNRWAKRQLLKQLCLGFQCDTDWDRLPKEIRGLLLKRCLGEYCRLSESQWQWLTASLCRFDTQDLNVHVARCNLGAAVAVNILDYAQTVGTEGAVAKEPPTKESIAHVSTKLTFLKKPFSYLYHTLGTAIKFFVIAMVAEPEFQREFDYSMSRKPAVFRIPMVFLLNGLWTYARFMQNLGLSFFLFHGRADVKRLWEEAKGMSIALKRNRVLIQSQSGTYTAFRHNEANGGFKLYHYKGVHKSEPEGTANLRTISTYSKDLLLDIKEEYEGSKLDNEYHYDYQTPAKRSLKLSKGINPKLPIGRRCIRGKNNLQSVQYNRKGLIEAGSYMKDGNLIRFKFHYRKNTRFGDELLRAEFVLAHISCTVSWCAPPKRHPEKIERWIPHSKITEATFVQGPDVYESKWLYDHKFHPTIFTTLNGQKVKTPPMIEFDYLDVLKKPKDTAFIHDNPLFYCDTLNSNVFSRWVGLSKQRFPVSTSRSRSQMWKAWKDRKDLDGVIVRWMDDRLLRRDKVLKPYWAARNRGNLSAAKKYLDLRADAIMASADLDDDVSSWTPLAFKISDLFNFGPGGDAVVHTRSKDVGFDTAKTLHVMAADNGTWPNEGGGVSACRRDMINSLKTIKWHMICESANDFGIPKHQTEQNVQSLKVIPLWGLDFLMPTHGLFKNRLDSEVDAILTDATDLDIKRNFIPTLTALVKGARAKNLSNADVQQATRALVNLNTYFQDSRHWSQVWTSEIVKESWRDLWLTQEMQNAKPSAEWFETELPTLGHLDTALDLWFRYLFIFSIPVPDKIPAVFQASHHSVSASYGVVCKIKRKCQLQIWDHAISWRETNLCLSSALCKLPPFVRNSLLGLMRMTSVLILHHADIILPCADFFNPGWEIEIGTCQGAIEHRNSFKRKIDPVVNGIVDMTSFSPVKEIKSKIPTVTMLSHVWYAKDIKTALLAADIIINEWGFDDYHLDIYGAIDKAPTYSTECQEIIASKSLRGQVRLCGTANPMKVLENTWLFLNSSLSEGLPLALGEAALTGAPVVCTDVGASLRVLSDPDDFSRYSAVVAPNDARALAKAQINLLGLCGEWSKYADDIEPAPSLSFKPTREEVVAIQKRMYDKSEQRRKLGMMTRNIVQKSFSGDRYLREHEQMLWIGKARKLMANRVTGDHENQQDVANAIDISAPPDEEVITIPRSAVHSWRSSAASGMSSAFTTLSNFPMLENGRPVSVRSNSAMSASSNDESLLRINPNRLPVFAPRENNGRLSAISTRSGRYSALSGRESSVSGRESIMSGRGTPRGHSRPGSRALSPAASPMLRPLRSDDTRLYRNSDVSLLNRDDYRGSETTSLARSN
jgi:glycosyltransferase involved in cell wall biosynthesis